jgi:hypothetical protein
MSDGYDEGQSSDEPATEESATSDSSDAGADGGVGYPVTCTCGTKTVTVYCPTRESALNATCDCSIPDFPTVWCG